MVHPIDEDPLDKVRSAISKPVSLNIVKINLQAGDMVDGLASAFAQKYDRLETFADAFGTNVQEAQDIAENSIRSEDEQWISTTARALFEIVREEYPDIEEMNWREFILAMNKSTKAKGLLSRNPSLANKAVTLVGQSFAEAVVTENHEGQLPEEDDPDVTLIATNFAKTALMIIKV